MQSAYGRLLGRPDLNLRKRQGQSPRGGRTFLQPPLHHQDRRSSSRSVISNLQALLESEFLKQSGSRLQEGRLRHPKRLYDVVRRERLFCELLGAKC
jgi:hypothetical protein